MTEEKTVHEVYRDRNALVLAFAELVNQHRRKGFGSGMPVNAWRACWQPDEGDDADADEWAIVYCWLPTGQVSWHVPRELAEEAYLPRASVEWDGHSRGEKNQRLLSFAGEQTEEVK